MIFRSYSQEVTTNSEPFSIDEVFNLFFPVSFTLSTVDFICHLVAQLLGFVQPNYGASSSSLVLTNVLILYHEQILPSHSLSHATPLTVALNSSPHTNGTFDTSGQQKRHADKNLKTKASLGSINKPYLTHLCRQTSSVSSYFPLLLLNQTHPWSLSHISSQFFVPLALLGESNSYIPM